jgi:signal transduction histidine kinase
MHRPGFIKIMFVSLLFLAVILTAVLFSSCAGDRAQANQLVREAEDLRVSAADKLRKATLAVDGLVKSAAAGKVLPPGQTKSTTEAAIQYLQSAHNDLSQRAAKLDEAKQLNLNDNYNKYLPLLKANNDKLLETINSAMEISRLLEKEQFSLAGWDEIKARQIVNQIYAMEINLDQAYTDAETIRGQAEQIKKDHPEDFRD